MKIILEHNVSEYTHSDITIKPGIYECNSIGKGKSYKNGHLYTLHMPNSSGHMSNAVKGQLVHARLCKANDVEVLGQYISGNEIHVANTNTYERIWIYDCGYCIGKISRSIYHLIDPDGNILFEWNSNNHDIIRPVLYMIKNHIVYILHYYGIQKIYNYNIDLKQMNVRIDDENMYEIDEILYFIRHHDNNQNKSIIIDLYTLNTVYESNICNITHDELIEYNKHRLIRMSDSSMKSSVDNCWYCLFDITRDKYDYNLILHRCANTPAYFSVNKERTFNFPNIILGYTDNNYKILVNMEGIIIDFDDYKAKYEKINKI